MERSKLPIVIAIIVAAIIGGLVAAYYAKQDAALDKTSDSTNTTKHTTDKPDSNKVSTDNSKKELINVAVYFAKKDNSTSDGSDSTAVMRGSDRVDIGTYSIEQLIAGPTPSEADRGLFSPLKGVLSDTSNCDGKDFSLSVANSVGTIKFCRTITSGGVGDDARIKASVERTLKQFSTVESVRILTAGGDCFGDGSGQNRCLDE